MEKSAEGRLRFYRRNPKLFTPRDFDYSPFFKILKYPLLKETPEGYYRILHWEQADDKDNQRVNYMNAEDIVFVSSLEEEDPSQICMDDRDVTIKIDKKKVT